MGRGDQFLGMWLALGVTFGAALDNMGLGIAIGVAIGAAMRRKYNHKQDNTKPSNH